MRGNGIFLPVSGSSQHVSNSKKQLHLQLLDPFGSFQATCIAPPQTHQHQLDAPPNPVGPALSEPGSPQRSERQSQVHFRRLSPSHTAPISLSCQRRELQLCLGPVYERLGLRFPNNLFSQILESWTHSLPLPVLI